MSMSTSIPRSRMIFKVLVLGRDLLLQTGFINRVSGERVTNQLYNTLGVSLGIAKNEDHEDVSTVLQLWSLPQDERLNGLTKTFTKGHRGVIAIIKPDEIEHIHSLLNSFSILPGPNLVVVVIGDAIGVEPELLNRIPFNEEILDVHTIATADDVISILSSQLRKKSKSNEGKVTVIFMDESQCPLFEPVITTSRHEPECSDQEVDEIRSILINQGVRVADDSCFVELAEGTAWISLRTGTVRLEPIICNYCERDCKRQTNICIIAVDSGWATQEIGQRALLTTAKVLALSDRKLPSHVEMQLQRASACTRFELDPDLLEEDIPTELIIPQPRSGYIKKTLLEVASERVKEGRLPQTAYNMLKRRLTSLQKSGN
ncbi:MAG: hypothetical protein RTU63_03325 [Candidatus Thorarchaeota archaeon]